MSNLRAACLPRANKNATEAIHAGWSEPPPFNFIQSEASGYTQYYRKTLTTILVQGDHKTLSKGLLLT